MRRFIAIVGAIVFAVGVAGVVPASATHCAVGAGIAGCANPVTIVIVEGQGLVCTAAPPLKFPGTNGTSCTYDKNDPSWVSKPVSQWNKPTIDQGLYAPGVGPGAVGPYKLAISGAPTPPANLCVSNVGGAGCTAYLEGKLTAGDSGVGAHCGSSKGVGIIEFTPAGGGPKSVGTLGWEQSAATILPTTGKVDTIGGVPQNPKPTIVGFSSSRGLTGAGNCGAQQPTTGFQVEGMTVTY